MSNIIAGGIAVLMSVIYLIFYAYRIESVVLWIIIVANLCALLYDYYNNVAKGEDLI